MVLDILFLVFAGIGFYIGYSRGIIRTVLTTFSLIVGLLVAFRFSPFITEGLMSVFKTSSSSMVLLGFALTFILTILVIRGVVKGIEKGFKAANINFVNKIAGGALIGAISTLLLSFLIWFGDNAGMINDQTKKQSLTYESLQSFPGVVKGFTEKVKPIFNEFYDYSKDSIEKSRDAQKEREAESKSSSSESKD